MNGKGVLLSEYILVGILILLLIIATVTDIKERLIYDRVIVGGLVLIGVMRLFFHEAPIWNYFLTGIGTLFVLATIAALTGGKVIGGGDIKLFALIGLTVGWPAFLYIFALSHVIAALYILLRMIIRKPVHKDIAFAPFILAGTVLPYLLSLLYQT